MIKLILLPNNSFLVSKDARIYSVANLKSLLVFLERSGIEKVEVEKAMNALVDKKHNAVEFGMNRSFIFSKLIENMPDQQAFFGLKDKKLRLHRDWFNLPSNKWSVKPEDKSRDMVWN